MDFTMIADFRLEEGRPPRSADFPLRVRKRLNRKGAKAAKERKEEEGWIYD